MRHAGLRKSTLVREGALGWGRLYLSLDDVDVLDRAQRAPELLLAVKRAVDDERTPGRFLLTGSANLLLMKRVSDTLAAVRCTSRCVP